MILLTPIIVNHFYALRNNSSNLLKLAKLPFLKYKTQPKVSRDQLNDPICTKIYESDESIIFNVNKQSKEVLNNEQHFGFRGFS